MFPSSLRPFLISFCFLAGSFISFAQTGKTDSLKTFINASPDDTTKANSLNELCRLLQIRGDYAGARIQGQHALALSEKLKFPSGIANAYNNLGIIHEGQGNYLEALNSHLSALKIRKEHGFRRGIAASYNNIGSIYFLQKDYSEALKNYTASLKLKKEIGNKKSWITSYNNLGLVYFQTGDLEKALENFNTSLQISEEVKDPRGIANAFNNIALVYEKQGRLSEALKMHREVLRMKEASGELVGIAASNVNLSALMIRLKRFPEAGKYCNTALLVSQEIGNLEYIKESYGNLYRLDSAMGNERAALEHFKLNIRYADSLRNEANSRKFTEQQMQYTFSRKTAEDSIRNVEKKKLENLQYEQEIRKQKTLTYGGGLAFVLMLVITGISFNALRQKRRAHELIRREKLMVEEKQKEILDSIHYAQRIQQSLLPTEAYIGKNLKRLKKA